MAEERPNPYSNFNFIVEIDNEEVLGFSEITGLDSESTSIEYREGGDPTSAMRHLVGTEKYSPVQLKRGITGSLYLWTWRKEARDGGTTFPPTRTVTIKLLNEKHDRNKPAMTWVLTNAWPTKITGPTLSAKGNEFAVEQLDLVHDRLEIS